MRIMKIFLLVLGFFTVNAVAEQIANNYSLAIYQSNCFTQAVIYTIDANNKPQVIVSAMVDSISEESFLGNSSNLRFTDGAASLINGCLARLSINYALKTQSDELLNIKSIVIGIAGYDTFKDDLYDSKTTRLNYFIELLCQSLEQNHFVCNKESIDIVRDIDLVNSMSYKLVEDNVIPPTRANMDTLQGRLWTFVVSSVFVGIRVDEHLLTTDTEIYLNNNEGGYYNLGKDTANLFTSIEDKSSLGNNEVQQLINKSILSKQLLDKRGYTLGYWLKTNPQQATRNNARGLAIVEYVLDTVNTTISNQNNDNLNTLVADNKQVANLETATQSEILQQIPINNNLEDTSVAIVEKHSLDLITASVNLIESLISTTDSEPSIKENDRILICGELLRSKFIRENYIKILDEKISNPKLRDRIQLVNEADFIYGLALAAEFIKENFSSDSDDDLDMLAPYSSGSSIKIENLSLFKDMSYDDSEVFDSGNDTSSEISELSSEEHTFA
jgi:hypothetical protein